MTGAAALITTAATLGTFHTLVGIDHYVPFIVMSKSNGWSMRKTLGVVFVCGLGHVLSSILLGALGIGLSLSLGSLEFVEGMRGTIATWFLVCFGLVYTLWGVRSAIRNRPHRHIAPDGSLREHVHDVAMDYHEFEVGNREATVKGRNVFWGLFILLVLGPCEPLIPILMYPAIDHNWLVVAAVTSVFGLCTIATMMGATYIGLKGVNLLPLRSMERYAHCLAGVAVFMCGIMLLMFEI